MQMSSGIRCDREGPAGFLLKKIAKRTSTTRRIWSARDPMNQGLSGLEEAKFTMGFDGTASAAWLSDIKPLLKMSRGVKFRNEVPINDTLQRPRNKMTKYKADGDRSNRAFFVFKASFLGEPMSPPFLNYM